MLWNGMEDDFSIFHTVKFLSFSGVAPRGGEELGVTTPPIESQMTSYILFFLILILKC